MEKECSRCGQTKNISDFYVRRERPVGTGVRSDCKSCGARLRRVWRTANKDKDAEQHRNYSRTPYGVWSTLRSNAGRRFLEYLTFPEFAVWYHSQDKSCFYCSAPEAFVLSDYPKPYNCRLTIDRLDNTKGYTQTNMVLACRICNQIKSNIFSPEEMKEISHYVKRKFTR